MSVLIPTMIGKHHLKLDMPGEFSNKVLQKCLTTTVGFSTALFLDFHQPRILQLPQGVDRFLPPAAEQSDHLADGVVQVDPPVLVRPAVLPGQLRPAQDKGIQHLRFVAQGLECGCFKKEIGEPGETERLFRLVNINRVCHSVFCGRLEARFPGRMINDTSRPG